jgi:hypothetical protein
MCRPIGLPFDEWGKIEVFEDPLIPQHQLTTFARPSGNSGTAPVG